MDETPLRGQTLLVVGGSSGIGLEAARRARLAGADVIITARDADRVVRAGVAIGSSVAAFDATDFDRLRRFVDELRDPLDHVLLTGPASYESTLADADDVAIRRDVDAHLMLPLHLARHAATIVRPGGTVTFIGCTDGRRAHRGISFTSALTAALSLLTKDLAMELAPVRVNLIAAGFVDTLLSAAASDDDREARREQLRRSLPIRRVVEPGDVAALAIHLMTNTAVTGATFDVDGGQQLVERGSRPPR
jgi:NAD(P)-dependent dehydrogenase (short-subunit alcohol dehydrogenase family)